MSFQSHLVITEHKEKLDRYQNEHVKNFFEYTKVQKSHSTLRTYEAGWKKFQSWCHKYNYDFINVSESLNKSHELLIGMFISDLAAKRTKLATLKTYLAGIKHNYSKKNLFVDVSHTEIRKALSGIRRVHGSKQTQKDPISPEVLRSVLDDMGDAQNDVRDRALILLGFAGAFRRSELVGIDLEHISFEKDGLRILIPKSKSDQSGEGRIVDIPKASTTTYCPVVNLQQWLKKASITTGPIFTQINKSGKIRYERLGDRSVALILKKRFHGLCNTSNIAGHSLRSGHVTAAVRKGLHHSVIMKQTGHKSMDTMQRYVRMTAEFEVNSAKDLV